MIARIRLDRGIETAERLRGDIENSFVGLCVCGRLSWLKTNGFVSDERTLRQLSAIVKQPQKSVSPKTGSRDLVRRDN